MKGLKAYGGLTTKVRAMKGNLISEEEYSEIANLSTISEMVAYLSKHPGYGFLLNDLDFRYVNRTALEELIVYSPCADFNKIYSFSNMKQKTFVDMYFIYFQIRFLKRAIRKLYNKIPIQTEVATMEKLFGKHANFNFSIVATSTDIADLILNLKDSIFYEPLSSLQNKSDLRLFDYEIALDLFYFKTLWKVKDTFNKKDREVLTHTYGRQIDMLNIMWIYRTKKYYTVANADIESFLIPVNYKIKKNQMVMLVNSDDVDEFINVLKTTYYGKQYSVLKEETFEIAENRIMTKLHKRDYRNNPFSLAAITNYLYLKDIEIKKLTTIAECIRYKYPPEKTLGTIRRLGGVM